MGLIASAWQVISSWPWAVIWPAVTGFVGIALGQWLALHRERSLRKAELKRRARFTGARIVVSLDRFVSDCYGVANDWGMSLGPDDGLVESTSDPKLAWPDDMDWESIDPNLLYDVLDIPNRIRRANNAVEDIAEHVATAPDHQEVLVQRAIEYGELGIFANRLLERIRSDNDLPAPRKDEDAERNDGLKRSVERSSQKLYPKRRNV